MNVIGLLSIVTLGFFLGVRHATDPDHVIAVTTIVARHRTIKHAAMVGAFWGLGHSLTILGVGGAIILLGWVIPARIGLSMEFSVGLVLILLGITNLSGILQWASQVSSSVHRPQGELQSHPHGHGGHVHSHTCGHNLEAPPYEQDRTLSWLGRHFGAIGLYQVLRSLVVGMLHGLAGSAAVALLVLTTIHNQKWAIAYLLVFGIGTVAGMGLITGAISLPFVYTGKQSAMINQCLRLASGVISLGFGLFLAYHIGFVNGLFTTYPHWTPR